MLKYSDVTTYHDLDVIIIATGYDGVISSLLDINIYGKNSRSGISTYLGMMVPNMPNAFTNAPPFIELQRIPEEPARTSLTRESSHWFILVGFRRRDNHATVLYMTGGTSLFLKIEDGSFYTSYAMSCNGFMDTALFPYMLSTSCSSAYVFGNKGHWTPTAKSAKISHHAECLVLSLVSSSSRVLNKIAVHRGDDVDAPLSYGKSLLINLGEVRPDQVRQARLANISILLGKLEYSLDDGLDSVSQGRSIRVFLAETRHRVGNFRRQLKDIKVQKSGRRLSFYAVQLNQVRTHVTWRKDAPSYALDNAYWMNQPTVAHDNYAWTNKITTEYQIRSHGPTETSGQRVRNWGP
ncbi:cyclopentanone 1,2-monooxygenase [Colletotrichum cuscutae]|uniref:Cyclopentanone 1,2-monooxygenase n=1 Tax=Colletotrichum cuscutae TaxID=1209917 RepID=A0AAI9YA24_9PEZI|nr:cyclopentanone 1,2-monooxygenase [Colletotrichum cuscutae]